MKINLKCLIAISAISFMKLQGFGAELYGWGSNEFGQSSPPFGEGSVLSIAAGDEHSLALRSDGTVFAFGHNNYGQSSTPIGLSNVIAVAAGRGHNLALRSNGTVVAWGTWNDFGQATVPSGLSNVVQISAHESSSVALLRNGTIVGWGDNRFGQIPPVSGVDSVVSVSAGIHHTLALRSDGTVLAWGENDAGQTTIPSGLSGVVAISAGFKYSLALRANGTIVGWGDNSYGQIQFPKGLTNVISIAAGHFHAAALKADGTVLCWGYNQLGQATVPSGLKNVKAIAAGGNFTLALASDGILSPIYLTDGLVAYYPFNGNAKDATANGNDGVINGGVALVPDRFGSKNAAQELDGQTGFVNIPKLSSFAYSDVTYSLWVYVNQLPPIAGSGSNPDAFHTTTIIGRESSGSPIEGALAIVTEDGVTKTNSLWYYTGADAVLGPPLLEKRWFHLVSTVSKENEVKIYVDGKIVGSKILASTGAGAIDFNLGFSAAPRLAWSPRYHFNGILDDVRIYNRALSDLEVAALYQYESVPQKTDPRQATATATVVNGFVVGATITDAGSGYTKAPKVVISGGGGTGATATATIDANGSVNGITIVSSGSKYTGIPTITIDPPPFPPSQAKGTSTVINGFVTGVNITDMGHGYEVVVPPVTFLGGGGKGATGTAIVSNGMVTGISMTASGSGYTNAPYVLIAAPPGLASAAISVRTVDVTLSLIPGYTYKIQTTTDAGNTWVDVESGILAVDKTMIRSFDVTSQTQLFRVVQLN